MPTSYTPQLGLSLPVQGELSGTWGDVTNQSFTSLVDAAIAGTTTVSTDTDVTFTATVGAANQARSAVILCNGARTAIRNLTAPATSKTYIVINATTGGFGVVLRGVGPTAGVTIPAGTVLTLVWNGADFVGVSAGAVSGIVGIANGGTGATTAGAALTALGGVGANNPTLTGTVTVPTPVNVTDAANKSYVDGVAFATALPSPQAGNAGLEVTTNGTVASWGLTTPGALAILNMLNFGF